jgi:hypothetical protein
MFCNWLNHGPDPNQLVQKQSLELSDGITGIEDGTWIPTISNIRYAPLDGCNNSVGFQYSSNVYYSAAIPEFEKSPLDNDNHLGTYFTHDLLDLSDIPSDLEPVRLKPADFGF